MLILISAFFVFIIYSFSSIHHSTIEVKVKGLKMDKKGNLRIGVFQKSGFPTAKEAIAGKIVEVTQSEMTVKIELNQVGRFALAVVQDQDKNGKLSTNLVGYPIEPYGFSNNKFGNFGPPAFEDVAFDLAENEHQKLVIQLK